MWYELMWYFLSNMWMNVNIWSTTITFNIATLTLHIKMKKKTLLRPKDATTCQNTRPMHGHYTTYQNHTLTKLTLLNSQCEQSQGHSGCPFPGTTRHAGQRSWVGPSSPVSFHRGSGFRWAHIPGTRHIPPVHPRKFALAISRSRAGWTDPTRPRATRHSFLSFRLHNTQDRFVKLCNCRCLSLLAPAGPN